MINNGGKEFVQIVADSVFHKVPLREGKFVHRGETNFRVVGQIRLVTLVIWVKVSGRVKWAHGNELKLAKVRNWENPEPKSKKRRKRRVSQAEPDDIETGSETQDDKREIFHNSLAIEEIKSPHRLGLELIEGESSERERGGANTFIPVPSSDEGRKLAGASRNRNRQDR